MKKLVSALLCAALLAGVAGCGGQRGDQAAGGNADPAGLPAPSAELGGEVTGEITVSCFDPMLNGMFLEEAAAAFQQKYPGAKINVSSFSAMPEIQTSSSGGKTISVIRRDGDNTAEQADYISKINTELMGGGGPDILTIDILPYYKYAESGQLEDLNAYMEGDPAFDIIDYRENIVRATAYRGGQYIFPVDYDFEYIAFDGSLFSEEEQKSLTGGGAFTYEQLVALGQKPFEAASGGDTPVKMFGMTPTAMYNQLLKENYQSYIDVESRTVNLDDGRFARMLETVKEYADKGYIQQGDTPRDGEMSLNSFEKMREERFFFKAKNSFTLLQDINRNSGRAFMYNTSGGNSGNEDDDVIAGQITGEDGSIPFRYRQAYGINANSENKALAWEFIKFLAGEEMQTSMRLIGIPVNNAASAERAKLEITGELYAPAAAEMKQGEPSSTGVQRGPGNGARRGGPTDGQPGEPGEPAGAPVNIPDEAAENAAPPGDAAPQDGPGAPPEAISGELTAEQAEVHAEYMAALDAFTAALDTCPIQDVTVNAMMDDEVRNYFDGLKTADEVASALQNKIGLYFSE